MGGRHPNFEDLITWTRDIRKTKFDMLGFFTMQYISCTVTHSVHTMANHGFCEIIEFM
jgi:hypothetical protein